MAINPERNGGFYQIIAGGTTVFNTETGEGDPSIINSLRISARRAARGVLSGDPQSINARAIMRWANSKSSKMPRMDDLVSTFQTAGLETFSAYIKGSGQE